ncbi:hypothetical protein QFC22_002422 [Naganishia vaughanmartiniae]|uniref:Uncharacterized protein n=1 Tax=Naganishia vaughanmartiniae TaxID=1424756 RepID=A0ACC2XEJ1_9TREE|nr:hypothetical protein QFC22_002422 [Naganishia vaughanmartiniae]
MCELDWAYAHESLFRYIYHTLQFYAEHLFAADQTPGSEFLERSADNMIKPAVESLDKKLGIHLLYRMGMSGNPWQQSGGRNIVVGLQQLVEKHPLKEVIAATHYALWNKLRHKAGIRAKAGSIPGSKLDLSSKAADDPTRARPSLCRSTDLSESASARPGRAVPYIVRTCQYAPLSGLFAPEAEELEWTEACGQHPYELPDGKLDDSLKKLAEGDAEREMARIAFEKERESACTEIGNLKTQMETMQRSLQHLAESQTEVSRLTRINNELIDAQNAIRLDLQALQQSLEAKTQEQNRTVKETLALEKTVEELGNLLDTESTKVEELQK